MIGHTLRFLQSLMLTYCDLLYILNHESRIRTLQKPLRRMDRPKPKEYSLLLVTGMKCDFMADHVATTSLRHHVPVFLDVDKMEKKNGGVRGCSHHTYYNTRLVQAIASHCAQYVLEQHTLPGPPIEKKAKLIGSSISQNDFYLVH
jgi:hypothetical protein